MNNVNGATVLDAETGQAVTEPTISGGRVAAAGYLEREFDGTAPGVVRLVRDAPAVYLDRPSARPGETLWVHRSCSQDARLRMRRWQRRSAGDICHDLGVVPAAIGEVPDVAPVAAGLEWPWIEVTVPEEAHSGLWLVELVSDDEVAAAPLVIRRRAGMPAPPVLAVASVGTWCCYNDWGGRNRYRNYESGRDSRVVPPRGRRLVSQGLARILPEVSRTRLKRWLHVDSTATSWVSWPLTFRRPWSRALQLGSDLDTPSLNHLAPLDARILAWLDSEEVDYECVADLDLEHHPELVEDRAAAILMGHSEYWSIGMYDAIRGAHLSGTWLLNVSGNTMYRQIEVSEDFSVRMNNLLTALSPRDETALFGVRYSERGYGTAAPYVVHRAGHWAFRGLNLAERDTIGGRCLLANTPPPFQSDYDPARPTSPHGLLDGPGGAAGFEVDRLVRKRRHDFTVIAEGQRPHSAQMVVSDPVGARGGVFSASSINFGASLMVDQGCAGVVRNVLRRALASIREPGVQQ